MVGEIAELCTPPHSVPVLIKGRVPEVEDKQLLSYVHRLTVCLYSSRKECLRLKLSNC
jgi:hypothetical protein